MNLSNNDACLKGMIDAQQFHGKVGAHVLLGFLFGPFAVIGAALANPTPYKGGTTVMLSKNRELFNDPAYLNCYKKKAKGKNAGNAAIGWGMWIALAIVASTLVIPGPARFTLVVPGEFVDALNFLKD